MGAWIKFFIDGSMERGSDEDIQRHTASWSQGRLSEIRKVRLLGSRNSICLLVPDTNWHQFDRFQCLLDGSQNKPTRLYRALQAEIQEHHVGQYLMCSRPGQMYRWAIVSEIDNSSELSFEKKIRPDMIGRWITAVLPASGYPTLSLATRGKINDDKHIPRHSS